MAFHWQTFKTRALTAIVFVAIMAAGLLWNKWSFFILFSVVHFGCWIEYYKLVSRFAPDYAKITTLHKWGMMLAGWCLLLYFTNNELQVAGIALSEMGLWCGLLLMLLLPAVLIPKEKAVFIKNVGYSLFGILYISLALGLLISMRTYWVEENYRLNLTIPLLTIFTIWVNDTMAYVVGSLIGKTPLSPVSPKKTWEGTMVALCLRLL